MWILTRAINQYDQDGEYFVAAWTEKPTVDQLKKVVDRSEHYIERFILSGAGRESDEYEWFYLTEVEEGKEYTPLLF